MLKSLMSRLTFSNVLSLIALSVALGGVSYAAVTLPRNSVGPAQLRRHAVKPNKLAAGSVRKRSLSKGVRKQLRSSPVVRLHFSADAKAGSPFRSIGTDQRPHPAGRLPQHGGRHLPRLRLPLEAARDDPGELPERLRKQSAHARHA